jgi:hypothetical protein
MDLNLKIYIHSSKKPCICGSDHGLFYKIDGKSGRD